MPAGLQVDATSCGVGPLGCAGSTPAQSNLVAENHPANALFQTWFDLRVRTMELTKVTSRFEAAWQVANGKQTPFALPRFESCRKQLSAQQLAKLDQTFRAKTRFVSTRNRTWPHYWFSAPSPDLSKQLTKYPGLYLLALHAADGHLRERAVRVAPMNDTAARAALLLRCNDWVAPVREAAFARLETELPQLDQSKLEPLCMFALSRVARWERGGAAAAQILAEHLDWPLAIKASFVGETTGPLARALRRLLQKPDHDWILPDLAMHAKSAFVRVVAAETLLTGFSRWTDGYDWVWHDKVFNLRRKVPRHAKREVEVTTATRSMVLRHAGQDKCAKMRCLAADYLIAVGAPAGDGLVKSLTNDKAKTVQWRMEFYHRKWGGNPSAQESRRK